MRLQIARFILFTLAGTWLCALFFLLPQPAAAQRVDRQNRGPANARGPQSPARSPARVAAPGRQAPAQRGGSAAPGAPSPQIAPRVPFRLTPAEQAALDRLLAAWEKRSSRIKTFSASFKRWEYDDVFNTETVADGDLKYGAPDKGAYRVRGDQPEHWVCDGRSIFEYDYKKKRLIERPLPPELQGKAIADGPLPFIFGSTAAKLKQRYFLRIITPPGVEGQIWLEAYPKYQKDAANFSKAELILKEDTLDPYALQIHLPSGKNRTVHQFYDLSINDPLDRIKNYFATPTTPFGWKRIVEQPPATPQATPGRPAVQAQRPAPRRPR